MVYTIYRVTNLLDGKIYIGKHQTLDPNDDYFGSGKAIIAAIKKYGKQNFKKEVLFIFESEAEMNDKERELITEDFVSRKDTYNIGIGGEGGPHFKGKKHSSDSKMKMATVGYTHTDEAKRKISDSNRRRKLSDETKKKLSEKAKLRYSKKDTSRDRAVGSSAGS
jgi:group I intron endonuclease